MENKILFLRISYWAGAILDAIAFLIMLFPPLFALNNGLTNFNARHGLSICDGNGRASHAGLDCSSALGRPKANGTEKHFAHYLPGCVGRSGN